MDRAELFELAERVEALSGPDREVDCTIGRAIGFMPPEPFMTSSPWAFSPTYTGSLDAAMTLVERPAWIRIDEWPDEFNATSASVQLIRDPQVASHCAKGTTPALALCAAALRALAKEEG